MTAILKDVLDIAIALGSPVPPEDARRTALRDLLRSVLASIEQYGRLGDDAPAAERLSQAIAENWLGASTIAAELSEDLAALFQDLERSWRFGARAPDQVAGWVDRVATLCAHGVWFEGEEADATLAELGAGYSTNATSFDVARLGGQARQLASTPEDELRAEGTSFAPGSVREALSRHDSVQFSVLAAESISPGSTSIVDVWAYLPDQYGEVLSLGEEVGRERSLGRKVGVPVERGQIVTVQLAIDHLVVADDLDTVVWDGVPTNAAFVVEVPADLEAGSYPGKAVLSSAGVAFAKVHFVLAVGPAASTRPVDKTESSQRPATAFVSYASEDYADVLARLQGMQAYAPHLQPFVAPIALRSGQLWENELREHVPSKDIFYLFWSEAASRSRYVEMEWRLALDARGLRYISPVPLVEPDQVPPPDELSALHFNDAYLAYIAHERAKRSANP